VSQVAMVTNWFTKVLNVTKTCLTFNVDFLCEPIGEHDRGAASFNWIMTSTAKGVLSPALSITSIVAAFFGSSCCTLQLLLNLFSFGCAGMIFSLTWWSSLFWIFVVLCLAVYLFCCVMLYCCDRGVIDMIVLLCHVILC
jgi:hypothetical protein